MVRDLRRPDNPDGSHSCTDAGDNTVETYADFRVVLTMETSNGNYKVDLPNHRMKMA